MDVQNFAFTTILDTSGENVNYIPFFVFQSTLLALKLGALVSPVAEGIEALIYFAKTNNLRLDFCWMPELVSIVENEKADAAA